MLYLKANPLLREPLSLEHIKPRLLGHWGSDAGQSFTYIHFNRLIKKYDLNAIYITGPGHGAPAVLSQAYLEGTYSEIYPDKSEDVAGMQRFFKQFTFPGGIGSHATPETPGSIHEGGELGYSISHAYGTVYDNPDLITLVMVGDGEAETGPLATSWHSNKFLNPITDGPCCRSCTSTATRSTTRRFWPASATRSWRPYSSDTGTRRTSSKAAIRRACTRRWRRRWSTAYWRSARSRRKRARTGKAFRPRWPDGHPAQPQGLDGSAGGGRALPRGLLAGPPDPNYGHRHQPRPSETAGKVDAQLQARRALRRAWAVVPELKALAPKGNRRMSANRSPTADWCASP